MIPRFMHMIRHHGGTLALLLVLAASLSLNVVLGLRLSQAVPMAQAGRIPEGARIRELPVRDAAGVASTLSFTDPRPTVLYIFSPVCKWCARNEANIAALVKRIGARYRFIAVSTTDNAFREYVAKANVEIPFFVVDGVPLSQSADLAFLNGLGTTPQMLLISGGKVEKAWVGAFSETVQVQVERFFDVSLPGLVDLRTSR